MADWPTGGHVFQQTYTIFELVQDIIGTNLLTKFHEDPTINVAATVNRQEGREKAQTKLPQNQETRVKKTPSPPGGHVFLPIQTIFELNCRIEGTNVLTTFHEDWAKKCRKLPHHLAVHVFPPIMTIFKLVRDIYKINANNVTSRTSRRKLPRPLAAMFFHRSRTFFELVRDINKTNVLTMFHDDWATIVTSRVFTRNTAPPPGGHIFQRTRTIF
ncbi:hypothetical protein DPMN_008329 [Dreissena polymorpha]|uniref:Uncharacterized protein n=1 Tax=Dreissena polymorpha TaxID=45954 RepID=A0A9D4MYK2_DREPO|nr:hypothetical protein DPMN_008329 [Dreissena polymorpha]